MLSKDDSDEALPGTLTLLAVAVGVAIADERIAEATGLLSTPFAVDRPTSAADEGRVVTDTVWPPVHCDTGGGAERPVRLSLYTPAT